MSELDSDFEEDFGETSISAENAEKTTVKSKKRTKQTKSVNLAKAVEDSIAEESKEEQPSTLLDAFSESMEKPISDVTYSNIEDYDFQKELSPSQDDKNNSPSNKKKDSYDSSNLEKVLNDYNTKFQEDVKLTTFNLKEKAQMEASIKAKWASILQAERTRGKLMAKARDTLIESLKEELSSSMMTGSYMSARQQIDAAINSNEHVKKLRNDIADNKQIVEQLEMYWIVIQGFGFTIKNSIETLKLDMGI